MDFASALMDGIGPRLTGSPILHRPTSDARQLGAMGCSTLISDDWGEFGMGWQQLTPGYGDLADTLLHRPSRALVAFQHGAVMAKPFGFMSGRERFRTR